MYKVTTVVKGRTVRKVETDTPFGPFVIMVQKDETAGKITNALASTVIHQATESRRLAYPANLDLGTDTRRYKITRL